MSTTRRIAIVVAALFLGAVAWFFIAGRHAGTYVCEANPVERITLGSNGRCRIIFDTAHRPGPISEEAEYQMRGDDLYIVDISRMMNSTGLPGADQFSRFGHISGGILTDESARRWKRQ